MGPKDLRRVLEFVVKEIGMPRVVILQEYVPTYRAPFFAELIRLGRERDIEIVVAAGQASGDQGARGDMAAVDYVTPLKQKELQLAGRRVVLRRSRGVLRGASLVILEQARRNVDAYRLLGIAKRWSSRKVALWGHGRDYVKDPSYIDLFLKRFLLLRCDWFFAYTDAGADYAIRAGVAPERISTVRNSVDTEAIRAARETVTSQEVEDFRVSLGLTDKVAIYIGGLDESKRIGFLMEAAAIAHNLDPDFRLLVVGDGADRHIVDAARNRCPAVVYMGAAYGKDKIMALISSQIIVMPGRVGLVAVDSLAAGRPIVTTNWPWHAPEFEYLEDGLDCLVSTDDTNSYADNVIALLSDGDRLRTMQANALEKSSHYTVQAMAERFIDGIESALTGGRTK